MAWVGKAWTCSRTGTPGRSFGKRWKRTRTCGCLRAFPAGLCGCNSFAVRMCPMQAQDAIEDIDATSDVHSPVDKPPYGQEDKQARSPRDGCI